MVNIGIIGYGIVGSGVYEVIRKNKESITRKSGDVVDIKYILDIRDFPDHNEASLFIKEFNIMLNDNDVNIIVETMGGLSPAYDFTKAALNNGKHVVTSNKELVATHGPELLKIAKNNNVNYLFEASVGGGIPIIRPLNDCLAGNEIEEIIGILNGTTNYILTEMIKKGKSFDDALKDAQEKGYAEKNPSADVDGHDSCRKIAILSSLAYGKHIDYKNIYTEGITKITLADVDYADQLGMVIKLIGYSKRDGDKVIARVSPLMLKEENPLSTVDDVFNSILVRGDQIGDVMFYGRGAGKLPTASAVVADIIDIAKNTDLSGKFIWEDLGSHFIINIKDTKSKYFVRTKNCDTEKIKALFSGINIISLDKYQGEIGFITNEEQESILDEKLSKIGEVISVIRVMD